MFLLGVVRRNEGLELGLGVSLRLRLTLGSALGGGQGVIVPEVLQKLLLGLAVHGFGASRLDVGFLGNSFKVNLVRPLVSGSEQNCLRQIKIK